MKTLTLIVTVLLASCAWSQSGIINEAKTKIEKQHHEALVAKAKILLEEKARIESRLTEINEKLERLDSGKDVSIGKELIDPADCSNIYSANTTTFCCGQR